MPIISELLFEVSRSWLAWAIRLAKIRAPNYRKVDLD